MKTEEEKMMINNDFNQKYDFDRKNVGNDIANLYGSTQHLECHTQHHADADFTKRFEACRLCSDYNEAFVVDYKSPFFKPKSDN